MNGLAAVVVDVVGHLGSAHVHSLSAAYRRLGNYSAVASASASQSLPTAHRKHVERLNNAWSAAAHADGASVALALETALAAKERTAKDTIDVVVTGPDSPAAPVRLTSEVVRQLIDDAVQRVMLVSFAAYQMPEIIAALDAAVARGVQVDLVLESPEKLIGGGGAKAYAKYRTFQWPLDQRDPPEAKLHAKAVIVDSRNVLMTSANMTNAAYDKNIELGVLCRGGTIAARTQKHFDALIARGVLRGVVQ